MEELAPIRPGPAAEAGGQCPTVRLHIWLESGEGMFFGSGRAQLLSQVERLGSLKAAALSLGMSYRAAWGKIRESERQLGVQLLETCHNRRDGVRLTRFGRMLMDMFETWFAIVEQEAVRHAADIFPFGVRCFGAGGKAREKD